MGIQHITAQSTINSAFISVESGGYLVASNKFGDIFGSQTGPIFGASAAFPLGKRLYLYGRLSYFTKNNTNEIEAWITNAGLKYSFHIKEKLSMELSSGFAKAGVKERTRNSNGTYGTSEGIGMYGGFVSLGFERKFEELPLALHIGITHNSSIEDLKALLRVIDGTSLTLGIRYYLPPPKKQQR